MHERLHELSKYRFFFQRISRARSRETGHFLKQWMRKLWKKSELNPFLETWEMVSWLGCCALEQRPERVAKAGVYCIPFLLLLQAPQAVLPRANGPYQGHSEPFVFLSDNNGVTLSFQSNRWNYASSLALHWFQNI